MSVTFTNLGSRTAIAARVAKRRRQAQDWNQTRIPGDYHLPFGRAEASAEAANGLRQR